MTQAMEEHKVTNSFLLPHEVVVGLYDIYHREACEAWGLNIWGEVTAAGRAMRKSAGVGSAGEAPAGSSPRAARANPRTEPEPTLLELLLTWEKEHGAG